MYRILWQSIMQHKSEFSHCYQTNKPRKPVVIGEELFLKPENRFSEHYGFSSNSLIII